MRVLHPLKPNPDLNSGYARLLSIADWTPVEQPQAAAQELISIPDAWAQVEVFRAALSDDGHPLHARAVAEWRGLIAIFALQAYHGRNVVTDPLPLAGVNYGLIGILNRMPPNTTLTKKLNWDQIGIIRLHGQPVGLLVPTTLVCPARRPPPALAGAVPWITADRILDPTADDVHGISQPEFAALAEFCRQAEQELRDDDEFAAQFQNRGPLVTLINAFEAFGTRAARRAGDGAVARFRPHTLPLHLPGPPLYTLLRNAVVAGGGSRAPDMVVPFRPDLEAAAAGLKGFVLIDADMPDQLGLNAAEITILGNTNLRMVLNQDDVRARLEQDAAEAGYLCVTPHDLFTDYFYRTDNVYIDAQPRGFQDALVPVTPAVLMMMSPEELRNAVTFNKGWDEVVVTLRLRLASPNGRDRYYTVQKTYDADSIVSAAPPTTLGFWPDFDHPDWRWHFAYYGGEQGRQFAPRTFVSAPGMAAFINAAGTPAARVRQVRRLMKEAEPLADRLLLTRTIAARELYRTEFAPEALYCDHVMDLNRASGYVESRSRRPVGMLLLPPRERVQSTTQGCRIGIDFGTVNTTAYWKRDGLPSPEPLHFANRMLLPFPVPSENQEAKDSYNELFPLERIRVPFMTVLRNRQGVENLGTSVPLWASYIYYVTDVGRAIEQLEVPSGPELLFDLKWEQGGENRRPVQVFLAQAVLQSLAEAAAAGISPANVQWRFSYPEAYTGQELQHFDSAARTAVRLVLNPHFGSAPPDYESGVVNGGEVATASESLSAALYFISKKATEAPPVGHLVTIDIGGLTSDVSIWARGRMIWRNSLKLAGRDIAIQYLTHQGNLQVLRDICAGDPQLLRLLDRVGDLRAKGKDRHAIEIVMNSPNFAPAFKNNYHLIAGDAKRGQGLAIIAELALLGILHYVGKTIEYCAGRGAGGDDLANAHFSVCLGGRTSMLYSALFKHGKGQEYLNASLGVFRDAAPGLVGGTHTVYTDDPKHEVAYGLVVDANSERRLAPIGHRVEEVILGEKIRVGADVLPPDTIASGLVPEKEWMSAGLDEVKAFLGNVNKHSGMLIELTSDREREISNAIDAQLREARSNLQELQRPGVAHDPGLRSESTTVEPPFIVAVRELVRMVVTGTIPARTR